MKISVAIVLVALVLGPLAAQAQLPDSPTGRGGNTVIRMFESGPEAVTPQLLEEWFADEFMASTPAAEKLHWLKDQVKRIGPLALRGVEKTGPFAAAIVGRSSLTEGRIEIRYRVADTTPHRIVELVINQGTSAPRRQLTQAEMVHEAERYLATLSDDQFSGTVLVAKGDEVLVEWAAGLASRRYSVPVTMDTLFNLGSINKIFTKIAIAQLAARGRLDFSDPISRHLPDYPNPEVAQAITIQQVVTHSAGLGDIFTEEFAGTSKDRFRTPQDYFELFADQPLLFEPGTSQRYSNGGYMVLGAIVEAVSGWSYDEYVAKHIFDPAGMTVTGSYAMDEPQPNLAKGYTRQRLDEDEDSRDHGPDPSAPWRENSFMIPFTGTPAGGGYSNAPDLLRFRHALSRNELLDTRYTTWVLSNQLPAETPQNLDLGIGIAGGAPGVNAEMEMGGEFTIIVLSNLDPPSASSVSRQLRALIEAIE